MVSLFLSFSWADATQQQAISPILAASANAYPILLFSILLILIVWIAALIWREAIVMEIQQKFIKLSSAVIIALGGGALAVSIYFLVASRGQ